MSEELRRALYSSNSLSSLEFEMFLPELLEKSEIIDDDFRKVSLPKIKGAQWICTICFRSSQNMYKKLPARVQGYNWKIVFSSAQHGFSLKSLYRKMHEVDTSIILIIQDTQQNVRISKGGVRIKY